MLGSPDTPFEGALVGLVEPDSVRSGASRLCPDPDGAMHLLLSDAAGALCWGSRVVSRGLATRATPDSKGKCFSQRQSFAASHRLCGRVRVSTRVQLSPKQRHFA